MHISYFNTLNLPALNAAGATSPKLKPASWNHAMRINGTMYAKLEDMEDEECTEYENYSLEQMEEIDYAVVEYMTPQGWSETPMWARF